MVQPDPDPSLFAGLIALLTESKREHDHCEDVWYCCRACRHPDHGLVDGEVLRVPPDCTCGASEWNEKVDVALRECGND